MPEPGRKDFAGVRDGLVTARFGRRFHGHGHGSGPESRAAVLDLAFDGLGAENLMTVIRQDNSLTLRVTRRLRFRPDGVQVNVVRGGRTVSDRLRSSRKQWLKSKRIDVRIEGLKDCEELFGLAPGVLSRGPAAVPDPTMAVVTSGIRYLPDADGGIE